MKKIKLVEWTCWINLSIVFPLSSISFLKHYYPDGGKYFLQHSKMSTKIFLIYQRFYSSFLFYFFFFFLDWGWIVCSVAFLAHILTTGFQLSYGFLLIYAIKHLGQEVALETSESLSILHIK